MKQDTKKGMMSIPIAVVISLITFIVGAVVVYYTGMAQVSASVGDNTSRIGIVETEVDNLESDITEIKDSTKDISANISEILIRLGTR